jgi:hypothetical protein
MATVDVDGIMSFIPVAAVIYGFASFFVISRRSGEWSRSQGMRRWRKMNLFIAFAIVSVVVWAAYLQYALDHWAPRS